MEETIVVYDKYNVPHVINTANIKRFSEYDDPDGICKARIIFDGDYDRLDVRETEAEIVILLN